MQWSNVKFSSTGFKKACGIIKGNICWVDLFFIRFDYLGHYLVACLAEKTFWNLSFGIWWYLRLYVTCNLLFSSRMSRIQIMWIYQILRTIKYLMQVYMYLTYVLKKQNKYSLDTISFIQVHVHICKWFFFHNSNARYIHCNS